LEKKNRINKGALRGETRKSLQDSAGLNRFRHYNFQRFCSYCDLRRSRTEKEEQDTLYHVKMTSLGKKIRPDGGKPSNINYSNRRRQVLKADIIFRTIWGRKDTKKRGVEQG